MGELKPKLRFPEFQSAPEWKREPLNQIADPVMDKATAKDSGTVLTLSAEHGLVMQGDYFGKKIAGEDASRYTKIIHNDFVYNDRTTKLSIYGTIKRLSKQHSGMVSPIYKCFRFSKEENSVFWEWYFDAGAHESQLRGLVNEGARAGRFNISIQNFLSTYAVHPKNDEQQKIADCLSSIDDLIVMESQKLDAHRVHKKELARQLFPQEDEVVPMLRFPEFKSAPEWKKGKISNAVQLISGLHLAPSEYGLTGKIPYFTGPSDFTNATSELRKWTQKSTSIAVESDILITVKGSGVGELWHLTLPCVAIGRQLMAIRVKTDCLSSFLYQFLMTKNDRYKTLAAGNLIPGLSRKDILGMTFLFPDPKEQQKIANCLSSIDDRIVTQSQRIDTLKTHKKGLMQQLFPALKEVKE